MRAAPFYGDPLEEAAAWRALSQGQASRAEGYRQMAAQERSPEQRAHYLAEAEKQEAGSRWHADKARQYLELANG